MDHEIYHYGIKGMKWGVRRDLSNHRYVTKKRQLAADKKNLERLNNGEHTSYGITKKRQAAFDKRDKEILEKRIAKNESFRARDALKARKDVKVAFKSGKRDNYEKASKEQGALLNKVGYTDQKKADVAFANARRVVKEAMLRDAGYSPEKAKKGAEWFESHNWNITYTDNYRLYDYVDDAY